MANDQHLYVVYLGGSLAEGRMGEDHEVVVVVAQDVSSARKAAKKKWSGSASAHVDAVRPIDVVDGYSIRLEPSEDTESVDIDNTYDPAHR